MACSSALKQIISRNVRNEVQIMEWSNKMDLIAVANEKSGYICIIVFLAVSLTHSSFQMRSS